MATHEPIPFATIGTGWITKSFIHAAQSTGFYKLIAVHSRSQDTSSTFAATFATPAHGIKAYTSLDALASDPAIKLVYIASPNSSHFPQAMALLQAGKHVIVEKPAVLNVNEMCELQNLAEKKNLVCLEAFRHLHGPAFAALRAGIDELGPIYGASLPYASRSSRYEALLRGETPNVFSAEHAGGALRDLGVYSVSLAIALWHAPERARYEPRMLATGVDGGGWLTLHYESFDVNCNVSKMWTADGQGEVYGEKGRVLIEGVADMERVV
ncbi:NAD(P)-binding protein, partial [Trichodelitschia bisporula]